VALTPATFFILTIDPRAHEVLPRLRTALSHQYPVHHPRITPRYRVDKSEKKTNVLSAASRCLQAMQSARHTSRSALAAASQRRPPAQLKCQIWGPSRRQTRTIPTCHLLSVPRPPPMPPPTLAPAQCHTARAESSHTSLRRKTAWTAMGGNRNARFAWKSSNLVRRWAGWSVFASFIGSAFETGGESKAGVVALSTSSTSEAAATRQARYFSLKRGRISDKLQLNGDQSLVALGGQPPRPVTTDFGEQACTHTVLAVLDFFF